MTSTGVGALYTRSGVAARCRQDVDASAFVRGIGQDGNTIAMVNAFECGWSVAFPEGSKWFLDQLFLQSSDSMQNVLTEARGRFIRFAEKHTGPEGDVSGRPGVSYTVAEIHGGRISVRWLGGDIALLIRGMSDTNVTAPHIIKTEFERKGIDVTGAADPQVMTILTRCFGPDSPEMDDVVLDEPWKVRAGDVLLLMSNQAFHSLGHDAVTFLGATILDPQQLADELADRAFARDMFYAAVHVTRFEPADVPSELRRAIAEYSAPPALADAGAYARAQQVLPLSWDPGGMVGIRASGSLITASWQEIESGRPPVLVDVRLHHARIGALWRLADDVSSLDPMRPRFPATTSVCPSCDEFRESGGPGTKGCPFCAYTGFTLPDVPRALNDDLKRVGSSPRVASNAISSLSRLPGSELTLPPGTNARFCSPRGGSVRLAFRLVVCALAFLAGAIACGAVATVLGVNIGYGSASGPSWLIPYLIPVLTSAGGIAALVVAWRRTDR